ncbi:MAG: HAMP domain-containing histidine kinase [Anaerolineae bacterium]|nr:HAMP domain-containing histidine kinase [Anaerolineae bacterium]
MSVRLRLTLLYTAILALTLVVFSVALYAIVSRLTLFSIQSELVDDANRVVQGFSAQSGREGPGGRDNNRRPSFPPFRIAGPDTFVQILNPDGEINTHAPGLGDLALPINPGALTAAQAGRATAERVDVEGQPLLMYTAPIVAQGRVTQIVQVARSVALQEQALGILRRILLAGTTLATVVAFGVGWLLAGEALRPIDRITQTAKAIGAERDFNRRVEYIGPNDELGRLATTFNTMLSELQAGYRQTEEALHAQRRFVADASHELRTPLTSIRGNLALLQREPPIEPTDRHAVISDMVDETDRLTRLIQSLLTLARADAGQTLRAEDVLVRPVIEDVARQAQSLGPRHSISIDAAPDVAVHADRDMLKQVLLILVDNAVKFTPPGGAVHIAVHAGGGLVHIAVADTGVGIPPAALPHVFTRFYRVDTARSGDSAGLGLSIAQDLVEVYHGRISVASEPGKGSVFTVSLPVATTPPSPTG